MSLLISPSKQLPPRPRLQSSRSPPRRPSADNNVAEKICLEDKDREHRRGGTSSLFIFLRTSGLTLFPLLVFRSPTSASNSSLPSSTITTGSLCSGRSTTTLSFYKRKVSMSVRPLSITCRVLKSKADLDAFCPLRPTELILRRRYGRKT